MKLHIIAAFPNSFLPEPGRQLVQYGLSAEQAAELCAMADEIHSHVRYPDFCEALTKILGVKVDESGSNAPSPFDEGFGPAFLLASRSPGTLDIKFVQIGVRRI